MELKIEDYLSEEEIKEIAKEEVTRQVRQAIRKDDLDRIISNSAYNFIWKAVDEQIDENLIDIIKEKTIKIINELSSYCIFRQRDAWQNEDSKAYTYVQQAIEDNKEVIFNRVKESMMNINTEVIMDRLNDLIYQVIEDKLCGKEK
jgi:hypothetical protein